jgi:Protein of unknown function (DUF2637)
MSAYQQVVSLANDVPSGVWVAVVIANIGLTMLTWGIAKRRLRRAGERAVHPERFTDGSRKKDTALTIASLVPAALFWGMVLAGSFRGLVAFGRNVLDWNGGAAYLVPGTLDGISVTFAFLAFRAVHKQKDPTRCYRVVWVAALSSAVVNFAYEYGATHHNLIAGGYLGLLSMFGMVIFHEFLSQFEEGSEYVRRSKRPSYGLRWLTWPSSTFCAFIAWENYPPVEGTLPTVLHGLDNLERVRAIKRHAAAGQVAERHADDLAAARRKVELAAVTAGQFDPNGAAETADLPDAPDVPDTPDGVDAPDVHDTPDDFDAPDVPMRRRTGRHSGPSDERTDDLTSIEARVPTTATTVSDWVLTWTRICANGDDLGPLNDDERARDRYKLSAKQLRNVRNAATSGALERKAEDMGVALPEGYRRSNTGRIDGRDLADIAA